MPQAGPEARPAAGDCDSHDYRSADAGAVADDDRGQDRALAQERGRPGQRRRRPGRDRDRQGDDGGRGGRRGRARQDRDSRRHRPRRGQHPDRADRRQRRRRRSPADGPAGRSAPRGRRPARSRRRRSPLPPPHRRQRAAAPAPAAEPNTTGATGTITVREALRDAIAEEMRRDDDGVSDRRGGRRIPGRLQGQPGAAAGIRRAPGHRHADHRAGLRRARRRRRLCRAAARSSSS